MINMKNKSYLFANLFLYELKSLLYNPSTYLFQLIFITGINIFIFLVFDFFNSAEIDFPYACIPDFILEYIDDLGIAVIAPMLEMITILPPPLLIILGTKPSIRSITPPHIK